MRVCMMLLSVITALLFVAPAYATRRVLYIDSYHEGYAWSDGITKGIKETLQGNDVILKIHRMDTKRNPDEWFKIQAGQIAKSVIDNYRPDIVIASDDNASKYLIMPYYKNHKLPFVFCGVNYDADAYGFPYRNVTGMVEVPSVTKLIYALKLLKNFELVGYLASDTYTERKDGAYTQDELREKFVGRYVKTFRNWKKQFLELQNQVDVLIVGNNAGIQNWNDWEAKRFVIANTRIPTGCLLDWMTPFAFLGATRIAKEQGAYAAATALKILAGTPVENIPIVSNTQAEFIINMPIAEKLELTVPNSFLEKASKTIGQIKTDSHAKIESARPTPIGADGNLVTSPARPPHKEEGQGSNP